VIALGSATLILAFIVALYAAGAALYGSRGDRRWVDSSRRAVYAVCALLTVSIVVLEAAFVRNDFSLAVVAQHSSTTTPMFPFPYKLTAMWSSQAGSLLLWGWVLSIFSSIVLYVTRNKLREIVPWATAVLMGLAAFFCAIMLFAGDDARPFARLSPVPPEGVGLTPLLRHPSMMIHPPMLYSGYVAFSIPFAFAVGALITRRLDASWIRTTRRFALIAWTFLSIGVLLGARWSYTELGWGGYWGWDPVENAALMPWLAGTAFLHSIMVQERRGMLKVWNVSLITATFSLALLGTFLVRSGVLQSIHAFGDSTVGPWLLTLIAIVILGSTALIISRLDELRTERRLDSLLSRESLFLLNNLLLIGLCVVIFWGTFFPLISEALTGNRSSLAAPWFDRYTTPLAIALVLVAGVGPLVAWRRLSREAARRVFTWPVVAMVATAIVLSLLTDAGGKPLALLLFSFAAFTIAAVVQEFVRGVGARRALSDASVPRALTTLVGRNRRRYGGYVVHIGIAVLLIGVAASSTFQTNRDLHLRPGQTAHVGGFDVNYDRPTMGISSTEQRLSLGADLDVTRNGSTVALLHPSRNYYPSMNPTNPIRGYFQDNTTSEVGLRAGGMRDLWSAIQPDLSGEDAQINRADRHIAKLRAGAAKSAAVGQLAGVAEGQAIRSVAASYMRHPGPANFRFIVNPMVTWLWVGAAISLCGALIALWPTAEARRRRVADVYAARLARELPSA
jgi:cytochrome c-type biogenesis protein CcmF